MSCNFSPNHTVAIYQNQTYTYSQFTDSLARNATCGGTTYIRPNVGGALLPWFYAVVLLLVHLPTVVIRATRWEKVQVMSLALAAFAVACTIQSFVSTKLKPEGVLVWMPLMLPLDAGAMMQLMVLIVEEEGLSGLRHALLGKNKVVVDASGISILHCFNKQYVADLSVKLSIWEACVQHLTSTHLSSNPKTSPPLTSEKAYLFQAPQMQLTKQTSRAKPGSPSVPSSSLW
jgi:hypothetical protein